MPPTLDLSATSSHSKMMVSTPRINLRRATSYNGERGPLSSTSSRFNFNHLIFASPPPSPRLPTLIPPPPRRSSGAPRRSRVLKSILWVLGASLMLYSAASLVRTAGLTPWLSMPAPTRTERYEMVSWDDLPDFPSPIVLDDRKRGASWTVSIPPHHKFPLTIKQYAEMPEQCREVARRVNELRHPGERSLRSPFRPLGTGPSYFVDIREAETAGILPGIRMDARTKGGEEAVQDGGGMVGEAKGATLVEQVCATSLTFVLESADAGLGRTLMALWVAYGLAQRQGRAFFVDDSRWAYGAYTAIFQPPPQPGCRAPRRREIVPCPYEARHLVVTPATSEDFFAAALASNPSAESDAVAGGARQRDMFDLARQGHDALFRLNKEDDAYVSRRVAELSGRARGDDGIVVGLHVRRGDCHPVEFQYRESYVPLQAYAERTRRILDGTHRKTGAPTVQAGAAGGVMGELDGSLVVLASDDPLIYESEELTGALRAQEQIKLASKAAIQRANPDKTVMHKFVDETWGWEGGFFSAVFWNLGRASIGAGSAGVAPSAETIRLRSLIGRAYMMDLAVLSRASDFVVCTVSAMGCKLLAVMMPGGWDGAVASGRWVNIDGDYGWNGHSW